MSVLFCMMMCLSMCCMGMVCHAKTGHMFSAVRAG